jgi:L-iditol 2-dehydrogenase
MKMKFMRTMFLTGIRQMELQERPMPQITKDTDVLIKMRTLGVCGSDIHYYTTGKIGSQVVKYPFPVGHEGAGDVVEIGECVTLVKVGDRIAIEPAMPCYQCDQCLAGRPHTCRKLRFLGCPGQADGCLSEYIVMPETNCFPIPSTMTYDMAVISEPLAIGVYAVRLAQMEFDGKSVGILGFGPIGMSVLLTVLHKGAGRVYVTDKIDSRLKIAKKCGAAWIGNPLKEDVVASVKAKEEALLDVAFECCGQQEAIEHAIDMLKPGGKLLIIGIPEFDHWSLPADKIRHKEICIQNVRRQNHALEETLDLLQNNKVDVSLMPSHRFKFSQTKEAFDLVASFGDSVMKAMIDFD